MQLGENDSFGAARPCRLPRPRTTAPMRAETWTSTASNIALNPDQCRKGYAVCPSAPPPGQRAQAVAVLEKASMEDPRDKAVLAPGRALARSRKLRSGFGSTRPRARAGSTRLAHISAQGAVLDGMTTTPTHSVVVRHAGVPGRAVILRISGFPTRSRRGPTRKRSDASSRRRAASGGSTGSAKLSACRRPGKYRARRLARGRGAANAAYLKQMLAHRKDLRETTRSARPR